MALELIDIDTREIFDQLKAAYYEQMGETLQIGSDAFASASVQAYAWMVLLNSINEATQNRFIDTATGEYLDAIASNYGIMERPKGYHASASFHLTLISDGVTIPANALVIQDSAGNRFTNPYSFYATVSHGTDYVVLQAVEAGTKYNGIPAGEINEIADGYVYVSAAVNDTMTMGGTDGFPYTDEGDNAYREWLKTEIQSFAGAGTYQAYEARAKNADSRVLGAYVLRQNDEGYEKGKVQIYIYTNTDTDLDSQVLELVQKACEDESFRPIGDLVEVDYSPLTDIDLSITFQVTYSSRFKGVANLRNSLILDEYKRQLESTINKPFSFEEFCQMFTQKDENGIYALDCKPLGLTNADYPEPIYPEIGGRLNPSDIRFEVVFSQSGA